MLIIILWGLKDNVYLFLKKIFEIIYEFLDDCGVWGCVGIIVNFIFVNYGGKLKLVFFKNNIYCIEKMVKG